MDSRHGAWILVSLAAWLPACEGKETGSGGNPNTSTSAAGCIDLITARCEKTIACRPFASQLLFPDVPSCVAVSGAICPEIDELPGNAQPVADYEACAAAYRAASCDSELSWDLPGSVLYSNHPPPCDTKPGTLADGSPCFANSQCQGARCDHSTGAVCGACGQPGPVGGACQLASDCEQGLLCGGGACAEPAVAGQNCDAAHACQGGLYCANGVCAALLGAGAACASTVECDRRQGLSCTSGICQPFTLASTGEPCDALGTVYCRAPAYCSQAPDAGGGTCTAPAPNGSPCGSARCDLGLQCVDAVCVPFQLPTCQ
jgi:hypothetical protein